MKFMILFVKSPIDSGAFYSRLLKKKPVEQSPTFVMFNLSNGLNLGLWSRETATPKVEGTPGSSEICFSETTPESVEKTYQEWNGAGVKIAQAPIATDGLKLSFVALDPDGHRIRVLCPGDE